MKSLRSFDFTGEVAIVTGAGSRMDGTNLNHYLENVQLTASQEKSATVERRQSSSPGMGPRLR
jgi:hypothetical protein